MGQGGDTSWGQNILDESRRGGLILDASQRREAKNFRLDLNSFKVYEFFFVFWRYYWHFYFSSLGGENFLGMPQSGGMRHLGGGGNSGF